MSKKVDLAGVRRQRAASVPGSEMTCVHEKRDTEHMAVGDE